MSLNLTRKIVREHLAEGDPSRPGNEIGIRIDQILTPDATGVLCYLQFESMGLDRVRARLAVAYADHVVYHFDARNAADHRYLQTAAHKYGSWFSLPGNGICHQVHQERFAVPGETLLGADSHTPTQGGLGMLAIGAGGLDVTVALGGGPYFLPMPEVVEVRLEGELPEWVTAKDLILEMLRRLSVKGGVSKVFEYTGPGAASLSPYERCTVTNMGTELGATTSVFATDERTRDYLARLGRPEDFRLVEPDPGADYDDRMTIDLSVLEPLVACPTMPDRIVPVREAAGTPIEQVIVGSCTNGGYEDLLAVAQILAGHRVHSGTNFVIAPSSKLAIEMIAREGLAAEILASGANLSESTCGACIGVGHVPAPGQRSLRSFNRNYPARSGIKGDQVYLASPEVCAVSAIEGKLTDPRDWARSAGNGRAPAKTLPERFTVSTAGLVPPAEDPAGAEVARAEHISDIPLSKPPADEVRGEILIVTGDDITTDDIVPATAEMLANWANIDAVSSFIFKRLDPEFPARAFEKGGGWIVGGSNYGQGSSREHAAMAPMYMGIKGVIAKSFARIHKANLVNFGLLPLTFADPADYEKVEAGDELVARDVHAGIDRGRIAVSNETKGMAFETLIDLTDRERALLKAGGVLPYTRAGMG
ncbi:MAG TPA: aconitate hydratase [Gemmatimonadota bacterium]|nr:aconitate hydratase [Gemmatimonadota bacterium]